MAASAKQAEHSVKELSHGLQSLADSSNQLVETNDELTRRNQSLKQKVSLLERASQTLDQDNAQLEKELTGYEEKNKDKLKIITTIETKNKNVKDQMARIDQEMAMRSIALAERQKQHKYVFELLDIVKQGGTVVHDIGAVKDVQAKLARQVQEGRDRIQKLENEFKELIFWYGDASVSMPKLQSTKDQLKARLNDFTKLGVSGRWTKNRNHIQKLEAEIKELTKQRSGYIETLEVIENKYVMGSESAQSRISQKKLESTLAKLKKDNKALQRQTAELRLTMVNLDKKKSAMEDILGLNK